MCAKNFSEVWRVKAKWRGIKKTRRVETAAARNYFRNSTTHTFAGEPHESRREAQGMHATVIKLAFSICFAAAVTMAGQTTFQEMTGTLQVGAV